MKILVILAALLIIFFLAGPLLFTGFAFLVGAVPTVAWLIPSVLGVGVCAGLWDYHKGKRSGR